MLQTQHCDPWTFVANFKTLIIPFTIYSVKNYIYSCDRSFTALAIVKYVIPGPEYMK